MTKETLKINVTLLKHTFRTMSKGNLGVSLRLEGISAEEKKVLKRCNTYGVMLDSVHEFKTKGLFPLSEHRIELNPETGRINFEEMLLAAPPIKIPTRCPSCNSDLVEQGQDNKVELLCKNLLCPAVSRTCVIRLLWEYTKKFSLDDIEAFLECYLVEEVSSIDNLFDFKTLFLKSNAYDKRNNLRADKWKQKFGPEMGQLFWDIEVAYQDAIDRTTIPREEFWRVCSFPSEAPSNHMSTYLLLRSGVSWSPPLIGYPDPQALVHSKQDAEIGYWFLHATPRAKELVMKNMLFFKTLLSVYNARTETTWTQL